MGGIEAVLSRKLLAKAECQSPVEVKHILLGHFAGILLGFRGAHKIRLLRTKRSQRLNRRGSQPDPYHWRTHGE